MGKYFLIKFKKGYLNNINGKPVQLATLHKFKADKTF